MEPKARGPVRIVVNPAAGNATEVLVSDVTAECRRWWTSVDVCHLGGGVRAADVVRAGYSVVVAVGGDGTARDVAEVLAGLPEAPALFVVPAGTANSCYRTWWGDAPWRDALAEAVSDMDGSTRLLDLARLVETGALVLAGACAGFPPQAIHEARFITHLTGPARYEAALVDLIGRFEPYPGRVFVDDIQVHCGPTLLANVGGSRYRGGQFELLPRSVLDDGLLDVCVIGGEHQPADVLHSTRTGAHLPMPGVVYARGRRVRIERTDGRPVWFEHDGEVLLDQGHSFTLRVLPRAVPVLTGPSADPTVAAAPLALSASP